jgi:hypothetical protein
MFFNYEGTEFVPISAVEDVREELTSKLRIAERLVHPLRNAFDLRGVELTCGNKAWHKPCEKSVAKFFYNEQPFCTQSAFSRYPEK